MYGANNLYLSADIPLAPSFVLILRTFRRNFRVNLRLYYFLIGLISCSLS